MKDWKIDFDIVSFEGRGKLYKYEFLWSGKLSV